MKKVILLSAFVLSLAFAGTVSAQSPAKKAPEKTVQAPAKLATNAAPAKEKKATLKKAADKKAAPGKKTK